MYQGHSNDGSSVQNHSVGDLYPFVVYAQETPQGMRWGVVGSGFDTGAIYLTEDIARACAKSLKQKHDRVIERLRALHRERRDPMIRMSTELLGYVWAPDVVGIPIIHTRRVQADRRAERAFWARKYCEDNKDLPVDVIVEGLHMQGYFRHEISTAITAYVMGVV